MNRFRSLAMACSCAVFMSTPAAAQEVIDGVLWMDGIPIAVVTPEKKQAPAAAAEDAAVEDAGEIQTGPFISIRRHAAPEIPRSPRR